MTTCVPQIVLHHVSEVHLLARLRTFLGLIWLHDHQNDVIGVCPKWLCLVDSQQQVEVFERHPSSFAYTSAVSPSSFVQTLQQRWHVDAIDVDSTTPLGFCGGLLGVIGYDHTASLHTQISRTMPTRVQTALGEYDVFFKKQGATWVLYGSDDPQLQTLYQQLEHAALTPVSAPWLSLLQPIQPRWSYAQYQQAFDQIQAYLHTGDCYQVNLTQAFATTMAGDLLAALPVLQALTHAPYAGYMRINAQQEILSCSPELFLSFESHRHMVTRPIKGTQPRHHNIILDAQAKQRLAESEKDQSENLMIVDLLRNDLSRYAQNGSVKVPQLFEIESFAQVHHLVSEITAIRRSDVSSLAVLLSALPGGSITGAPKIRAMQIIHELEVGARGAYCGSMGYLNYNDTGRWNILIRTIQRDQDQISVWAGGGITIASDCASEYQECMDKVGAILQTLNEFVCPTTEADAPADD